MRYVLIGIFFLGMLISLPGKSKTRKGDKAISLSLFSGSTEEPIELYEQPNSVEPKTEKGQFQILDFMFIKEKTWLYVFSPNSKLAGFTTGLEVFSETDLERIKKVKKYKGLTRSREKVYGLWIVKPRRKIKISAIYDSGSQKVISPQEVLLGNTTFLYILERNGVMFFLDGSGKSMKNHIVHTFATRRHNNWQFELASALKMKGTMRLRGHKLQVKLNKRYYINDFAKTYVRGTHENGLLNMRYFQVVKPKAGL